jgi:predicted PurR-regulated permease PerM
MNARIGVGNEGGATPPIPAAGNSTTALGFVFAIAALYIGREIFVPLALAVLLSFMLVPLLTRLQRWRVPKIPAVIGLVAVAFAVVCGFAFVVAGQLIQLADNLPSYQSNIQIKIRTIKIGGGPDGLIGRISEMLRVLGDEVARPAEPLIPVETLPPSTLGGAPHVAPIPVEIAVPDLSPLQVVETVIGPLIAPLATAGIVIVFVIFILLHRHDLRDRVIRLASVGDLNRTTQALEDAGSRVANYLLIQVFLNVVYGIPIGIGLWLIGVPNPVLWGILAVVLRFIPYIGPILAAAFPIALSIAVDPGWAMLVWTVSLFVVLELVSNNIVEPWLYGTKTGLSPIAIIVAAIFWTWLWGPVGLLLSTPLTVCIFVLGRHVPQFAFLDVLLGSERVLTREECLHQRLLALNPDEATENAEEYLREHSLEEFYNEIAIPALVSIERDRARGALDEDRRGLVADSVMTLIDNLSSVRDKPAETGESKAAAQIRALAKEPLDPVRSKRQVLCVGARGNLDDAAAAILSQLAERRGIGARVLSSADASPANLARVDMEGIHMVCLLYLNENSIAHARYLIRRLQRRAPAIPVLVAFLSLPDGQAAEISALKATNASNISTSLAGALGHISAVWDEAENPAIGVKGATAGEALPLLSMAPMMLQA